MKLLYRPDWPEVRERYTRWWNGEYFGRAMLWVTAPEMYRRIFLPQLVRQTEFLDYTVYHCDGIGSFAHVPLLCEIPRLQAIQILPGAGKPSPLHYRDVLEYVQRAGKNLHISVPADEVEAAVDLLSARGLCIETAASSETEARRLLGIVERKSKVRTR